jgi:hypothetical protein
MYSAVVLTPESHDKLVERFKGAFPEDWTTYAHHMTINMGPIDPNYKEYLGKEFDLEVISFAKDDLVAAAGVRGFPTNNEIPHITLGVNKNEGGKPFFSNKLKDWTALPTPFTITGRVQQVD